MEETIFEALEKNKTATTSAENIFDAQETKPVAEESQEQPQVEDTAVPVPEPTTHEVAQAQPEPTGNEKNIRALREKAERADRIEREYQQALWKLQQYEQMNQTPKQKIEPEYEDNDFALDDDSMAEGKHIKKLQKEIKKLKAEYQQQTSRTAEMAIEAQLKMTYPDFDKVVNSTNLAELARAKPHLAQTIQSNPDLYSKAVSAYEMIRSSGVYTDQSYAVDRDLVARNMAKPKVSASLAPQQADSPLNKVNAFAKGLTPDLQKQLYKEMMDAMNNR